VRLAVVDDDHLVRLGLRAVLAAEPGWTVVAEAADGDAAVEGAERDRPDLMLMDVRMPGTDGLTATRRITALPDPPRVLVLTTFEVDEYVFEALRAGAGGFVLKRIPPAGLVEAVRTVAAGESLLFPTSTRRVIERFARPVGGPLPELSHREQDVLRLLAAGLSNAELALRLHVTVQTVKTHVAAVLLKLGVRDRTQAVIAAYEAGFVVPGAAEPP
jgi:DNA-binding NarL/FixJ family response regulator